MKIVRPLVLCFATAFPLVTHALQFPQAPDPELQALVDRFAAESETILDASLREKPPVQEWPCVADALMADLQESLRKGEELAEQARKIQIRAARAQGQDSSMVMPKMRYVVEELVPIRGHCQGGKLEGEAEFWVRTSMLTESAGGVGGSTVTSVQRYLGQYAAGKRVGIFRSSTWVDIGVIEPNTQDMDPKLARKMAKINKRSAKQVEKWRKGMPTVMYWSEDADRKGLNANFSLMDLPLRSELLLTSGLCTREISERRTCWTYSDRELAYQYPMKNMLQHGEHIRFAKEIGRGIVMPEERKCFMDGVEVKTTTCNVD
ncbi:MAG: hypothetical protein ACLGHJ_09885 [Gammaproteobacteria bacterium]